MRVCQTVFDEDCMTENMDQWRDLFLSVSAVIKDMHSMAASLVRLHSRPKIRAAKTNHCFLSLAARARKNENKTKSQKLYFAENLAEP